MRVAHNHAVAEIDSMPGCGQVAIVHGSFVPNPLRGLGHGKAAHKARLQMMADLGYDVAICTVDLSNLAQVAIMRDNNWTPVFNFWSSKTGNRVGVYMRDV